MGNHSERLSRFEEVLRRGVRARGLDTEEPNTEWQHGIMREIRQSRDSAGALADAGRLVWYFASASSVCTAIALFLFYGAASPVGLAEFAAADPLLLLAGQLF